MKVAAFVLACILTFPLSGCSSDPEPENQETEVTEIAAMSPSGSGMLVVAYMPDFADTFPAVGTDSLTVLDWLRQACESADIPVDVQHYSYGDLVDQIGSRINGDGGNWLYKVNGGMVPESAGSHRVSPDDTVKFVFE